MLGKMSQSVFIKIYVLILLDLMFWGFTLLGGIVLGVGPALRTITELYLDTQSDYQNVNPKRGWHYFKQYFWAANKQFYGFAVVEAVLLYNLSLSTQLRGLWVFVIQFILIFAALANIVLAGDTLLLVSRFAVETKNAIKLAFGQFFDNFTKFLLTVLGLVAIGVASYMWPGLLIFLTIGTVVMWFNHCGKNWYAKIDKMLATS
ncbi:YesL family protein [Schleiferilactobacillus perolens]|jgi:uncharacterized membrane protein YesL|uniref:YesL family protein n=1 Tax=Schleiferilactobacillus perolens TaxID=100468 RepID=UPI002351F9A3|nr:DUF624 domain-containing protein [Schleiferilactobacillus perolens]MCI2171795.1 DUF624 domain-containing protein [Schleiferilactobacillus perolens]